MFGAGNKPSIFGSQPSTSAFGTTGFGTTGTTFGTQPQQQQQQSSLFGGNTSGFGTSGTNLFGGQTSIFGSTPTVQQNTGFGGNAAFGSTTSNSLFGSTTANKSLFGGNAQFGSSNTLFGQTAAQTVVGTTIRFNPLIGTDTMLKNNVNQSINTRHECITCMKEYESKSLEELRFEDYQANRKGPQMGSGVFGSMVNQQNTLFSSTPGTSGVSFGNPTQNTSLFGTPKPFGTTTATTTTNSLFNTGFNKPLTFNTQTTNSPFASVQPQQPQTMFGQPPANTFSSQPNFFSNTQNNTALKTTFGTTPSTNQTSLFSNTATSTAQIGVNKAPIFGVTPTSTFGTQSTGFSFNPTTTNSLFSSQPSLFNTNTNTTTNKPMFNFPTQTIGTQQATNPLSTNTGTTGSLFNTNTNLFNSGTSVFGNTNTGNSLFSNTSLLATPVAQPVPLQQLSSTTQQPTNTELLLNRLQVLPYGDSSLFQSQRTSSSTSGQLRFTTDPKTLSQYKINFKNAATQKLPRSPNVATKSTSLLFDGLDDDNLDDKRTAADIFAPRRNIKKLIIKPKEMNTSASLDNLEQTNALRSEVKSPTSSTANTTVVINANRKNIVKNDTSVADMTINDLFRNQSDNQASDSPIGILKSGLANISPAIGDEDSHAKNKKPSTVILTKADYYTIPTLSELDELVNTESDSCVIDKFTVGRYEYGSIYWEGPLNVKGLNLDEVVHIRRKEVIVYPDDETKPPLGEGLNRPAQITLHQVWPIDKVNHEPIKDISRLRLMKYSEKIEKATLKLDAIFKEYRPDTGTWVFKVKHFSKYGLAEDDDDEENESEKQTAYEIQKKTEVHLPRNSNDIDSNAAYFDNKTDKQSFAKFNTFHQKTEMHNFEKENDEQMFAEYSFTEKPDFTFDSFKIENEPFPDDFSRVRQIMFDDEDEDDERDEDEYKEKSYLKTPVYETHPLAKKLRILDLKKENHRSLQMKPELKEVEKITCVIKQNLILKPDPFPVMNKVLYDISSVCCSLSPKVSFFNGNNKFTMISGSTVIINSLELLPQITNHEQRFESQCNEHSLITSNYKDGNELIPYIETKKSSINANNNSKLNKLIEACYGELALNIDYGRTAERLNNIIAWLCEVNLSIRKPKNELNTGKMILYYLSCNNRKAAVDEAIKGKNYRLALVISSGENYLNKEAFILQLASWKKSGADKFIDEDLLKIYVLLSGGIKWKTSYGKEIDVIESLEWTQQLSLMLLFMTYNDGLTECIASLTAVTNDVEYHLLAQHSPWSAISAAENDLEAWFLHQSLECFGVISPVISAIDDPSEKNINIDHKSKSDVIHGVLVSALMSKSIKWSCFVACHINDDQLRRAALYEILSRNCFCLTKSIEQWLIEHLLIPKKFISNCHSLHAKSQFDNALYASYLLESERWVTAHEILVKYIFPELVIKQQYKLLNELIEKLQPHTKSIPNWYTSSGAHVYELFCDIVMGKDDCIGDNYDIVNTMQCDDYRQILSQSEMIRKVSLIKMRSNSNVLFTLNTPIPDDYVLSELKYNSLTLLDDLCSS